MMLSFDFQDNVEVQPSMVEDAKAKKNAVSLVRDFSRLAELDIDRDRGLPTMSYP